MLTKRTDCEPTFKEIIDKVKSTFPSSQDIVGLSDFFKVMGDSTRMSLLWALQQHEICVGDLAVLLDMTKSAVSHQLKILKTAKLIKYRKDGKNVFYSLDDNHINGILKQSLEHIQEQ